MSLTGKVLSFLSPPEFLSTILEILFLDLYLKGTIMKQKAITFSPRLLQSLPSETHEARLSAV